MSTFIPMTAATLKDVKTEARFPLLASPKLDGIRCLLQGGKARARSLKLIPNVRVRTELEKLASLEGCDGELVIVDGNFQSVTSYFMSQAPTVQANWYYAVFDKFDFTQPFTFRYAEAEAAVKAANNSRIQIVPQILVNDPEELEKIEETFLDNGFEGVILRDPNGRYKCGRSTLNSGELLKLKRFSDSEAEVIGFTELEHQGPITQSNLLGALTVRDIFSGVEFDVGTGFVPEQRAEIFRNKEKFLGKICKYKYFKIGMKIKPRHPVFLGWRAPEDM